MSKTNRTRVPAGIEPRCKNACRSHAGGRCNCNPSYRGKVSGPNGRITGPWLPTIAAAVNWRIDTLAQINRGGWFEPTRVTVNDAAEDFLVGAEAGTVLSRKGERYSPSTLRGYDADLRLHVLPSLGSKRLSEIKRGDVQRLVDVLVARGLAPSSVRNAIDPLRRIFDRAVKRDIIPFTLCPS
jgi:hypothetical protein